MGKWVLFDLIAEDQAEFFFLTKDELRKHPFIRFHREELDDTKKKIVSVSKCDIEPNPNDFFRIYSLGYSQSTLLANILLDIENVFVVKEPIYSSRLFLKKDTTEAYNFIDQAFLKEFSGKTLIIKEQPFAITQDQKNNSKNIFLRAQFENYIYSMMKNRVEESRAHLNQYVDTMFEILLQTVSKKEHIKRIRFFCQERIERSAFNFLAYQKYINKFEQECIIDMNDELCLDNLIKTFNLELSKSELLSIYNKHKDYHAKYKNSMDEYLRERENFLKDHGKKIDDLKLLMNELDKLL
jgi:hypothetical protein